MLAAAGLHYAWDTGHQGTVEEPTEGSPLSTINWNTTGISPGRHSVTVRLADERGRPVVNKAIPTTATDTIQITSLNKSDVMRVALQRSSSVPTRDQAFWSLIRSATAQVSSARYADFIERALCPDDASFMGRRPVIVSRLARDARDLRTFTYGVGAYEMLKTATQIFLLLEAGGCDAKIKDLDLDDESSRFGEPVTADELKKRLCRYLTRVTFLTSTACWTTHSAATAKSSACSAAACWRPGSRCRACSS